MVYRHIHIEDLEHIKDALSVAVLFESLGYDADCDPLEVSDLQLSPSNTEAIKTAYLIANQEKGTLQVFLLELEPKSWSSNAGVIVRLTAIAKNLCQRDTDILIVATVNYQQLVLISPFQTLDQQLNLKLSIAKMFINVKNPSFYDLNQLEKIAAHSLKPSQLYQVQHQTLKQVREEKRQPISTDLVQCYLREIGRIPLLKREDEISLAQQVQRWIQLEQGKQSLNSKLHREPTRSEWANATGLSLSQLEDAISKGRKAQKSLVYSNLRLVVSIAKIYQHRGLELLDLIQHGNEGLIKATEKFDPIKGYKFSTYATHWIRQHITRGLCNESRIIRLPVHIQESLSKVKKTTRHLTLKLEHIPSLEKIAVELEMSVEQVKFLRRINKLSQPSSLDALLTDDLTLADLLPSKDNLAQCLEQQWMREEIDKALSTLKPREQEVLTLRFGLDGQGERTLEKIGDYYGLTRERIRQVQDKALRKFKVAYNPRQHVKDRETQQTTSEINKVILPLPQLFKDATRLNPDTSSDSLNSPTLQFFCNPSVSVLIQFQELNAHRRLYANDDSSLKQHLFTLITNKYYAKPTYIIKNIIHLVWGIEATQTDLYSIAQNQLKQWGLLPTSLT
ncbi:sigma-70 family RNA polymerase sigma factor [Oscillatoria acuminata]|uniref:RNA polymerase sigma factor, sigma-70 family n=1 Tax=Oscillatoria acuminata PCC 6304 TaxID=56110 RepID=K9TLJ7_9CYAN|nr:sigma-70 family RNA polymerase sigma factor [Oscillatoria acuminata]AFY82879.1 RNA polymerase sigma factor, sigma-70 family [Oscillatoria acuminata PCC 6304]